VSQSLWGIRLCAAQRQKAGEIVGSLLAQAFRLPGK
jgi:hypothetical protein